MGKVDVRVELMYTGNATMLVNSIEDEASRIRRHIETMMREELLRRVADIEQYAQRLRNELASIQGQTNHMEQELQKLQAESRRNGDT